ncbi:hypothetical protein MYSTI_00586 [Myxococcus stipitatus DSM 14675]|uniref:Uncharacterized protein n=1 Tax=Myxococcus stipitatus (strain DSM 14675 / JCM 12634 / Mx s8) TaxID=1278073 RepID=L7TZL6_MYXSD|nr:Dickkopf N-terminal cysteine-rich domain-containing protein [Myxococcus stipitatus]AGC41936.1 hypothetical protein MYSTI_00586 [Myxococcus stipitatus DSM 14675]
MKHVVMGLFLALAVVGCGGTKDDDGGNDDPGKQGEGLCSASKACPSGQFCFNGLCAIGCQSNANCAADQYCDLEDTGMPAAFCKNKKAGTCSSNSQCLSNQICIEGLCSLKPPENPPTCNPNTSDFKDGCDTYSVCLDPDDQGSQKPYCASFAPCPEDGVCPTGLGGAVCNDGYLQNKGRFCMQGLCRENSNCPSSWNCVKPFSGAVLGFCSPGALGFPCTENSHCKSGQCFSAPGMMGACM